MSARRFSALLAVVLAMLATVAGAEERILDYASELRIQTDGSLEVTENIRIRAEGQQIRRGIYRDFPTRYRDRLGNRVVVDFELLGVERDGVAEPYFTEQLSNGVRINTGNDDFLPVPAEFVFTLRYRTTRQLGHFDDFDELYWNVNGLGWAFPVDSVSARVVLPGKVAFSDLKWHAYTGPEGDQGEDYGVEALNYTGPGGAGSEAIEIGGVEPSGPTEVRFRTTRALGPQEGLTVALAFPKGMVPVPSRGQRWAWFLRDNGGALVALVGLALLLAFYGWRWNKVGRDPQAGPVFPHYDPPADLCAGEVRMLRRMAHDSRCFAADVVQMGVRGYLDIHADSDKNWRLVRRSGAEDSVLSASQQAIAEKLFAGSDTVALKNTEAARVGGARMAQALALGKRLTPAYFVSNMGTVGLGLLFSVGAMAVAGVIAAGSGIPVLFLVGALMLVAHIVFASLLKAPTPAGRKLMDGIEGLKLYLEVAERDEIRAMPAPGAAGEPALDAARYEVLLPYAMALDVEAAWSDRFTRAVGVEEARAANPSWYHGRAGTSAMGLAGMGASLGTALTQHISSSSSPPGGSSGSGGGGSSGGGGGGGGGGGR